MLRDQFSTLPLWSIPFIGIWEFVALYFIYEGNELGVIMLQVFMGGVIAAVTTIKGPWGKNKAAQTERPTMFQTMGKKSLIFPLFAFVLVYANYLKIGSGPSTDLVAFSAGGFVVAFILANVIGDDDRNK
jgi:hypothetical protein